MGVDGGAARQTKQANVVEPGELRRAREEDGEEEVVVGALELAPPPASEGSSLPNTERRGWQPLSGDFRASG